MQSLKSIGKELPLTLVYSTLGPPRAILLSTPPRPYIKFDSLT